MKLKLKKADKQKHSSLVCQVVWDYQNFCYSISDDRKILKWKHDGTFDSEIGQLDGYPTCMDARTRDIKTTFVIGTSEGNLLLVNNSGRVEKKVSGHRGAIIAVKWSTDGTSIATSGEDANVKIWSSAGTCRFTIEDAQNAVQGIQWAENNSIVLFCSEKSIYFHNLNKSSSDSRSWEGHSGLITQIHWNQARRSILTAGEDKKFKIWNTSGVCLLSSPMFNFPISVARWSLSGEIFTVMIHNELYLVDFFGRILDKVVVPGGVLDLHWTQDGSHFSLGCADGSLMFGQVVHRKSVWSKFEALLTEENKIIVRDTHANEVIETLDPDGKDVLNLSLAHNHLIAASLSHCYIWQIPHASSPSVIDCQQAGSIIGIIQVDAFFILLTASRKLFVYEYDGRLQASPNTSQLSLVLTKEIITVNSDILAVVNYTQKGICFLDPYSADPIADPFSHTTEITNILIAQNNSQNDDTLIAFIDRNQDLYIMSILKKKPRKLATMVTSCGWHETFPILLYFSSGKLTIWFYPRGLLWTDNQLAKRACFTVQRSELNRAPKLLSWSNSKIEVERADSSIFHLLLPPYITLLHQAMASNLDAALKLCQRVGDGPLWSCLACMAIEHNLPSIAVQAMRALNRPAQLSCLQRIDRLKSKQQQLSELCAFRGEISEAEQILTNASLYPEAIRLNIRLRKWQRALDLALSRDELVGTLLSYRKRFLTNVSQEETLPGFLQASESYEIGDAGGRVLENDVNSKDYLEEIKTLLFEV